MMVGDAALPLAPASVALGRGPSHCPPALGQAVAPARHPLWPGGGAPARAGRRPGTRACGCPRSARRHRSPIGTPSRPRHGRIVTPGGPGAHHTVFSPEGLVAWALAPDDGPPTTVLYPGPPAAWSPGADRRGLARRGADRRSGVLDRCPPRVGITVPGAAPALPTSAPPGRQPDPGVAVPRPGGGRRIAGLRLAARANGVVIPAPRRFRLGRRPAVPLVVALVVGIGLALLAVLPTRPQTGAPPAQAALVAPGQVTGLALGDDRLPDCTPVVATLSPRQKLAQRLMVGVVGTDPAATARLVHEMQVGGIFVGGTATAAAHRPGAARRAGGVAAAARRGRRRRGRPRPAHRRPRRRPAQRPHPGLDGRPRRRAADRPQPRQAARGERDHHELRSGRRRQRPGRRRGHRRPVVLARRRHRHRLRRRLRAGRARGGHLHRAQALPRARPRRRRLAPRPRHHPAAGPAEGRRPHARTPGCSAPAARWPTPRRPG